MNIRVQPGISGAALPCLLFKAGQFVRIKRGETVGRVLEDTDVSGSTNVQIFDDDSWGTPSFGPGCLTMWTPEAIIPPPAPLPVPLPPLDCTKATELLMKLLAAFELTDDLGRLELETGNDSPLPFHLRLIGSTFSETTCDLLDMVRAEESRQETAQD
jgi:hypothetical protein